MKTKIFLKLATAILIILSLSTFLGIVVGLAMLAGGINGSLARAAGLCVAAVAAGSVGLAIRSESRRTELVPGALCAGSMILTAQAIVPAVW
ncbi:MAG: hypothetical protein ACR2QU_12860 [Gammaproteobacteria bacterium]